MSDHATKSVALWVVRVLRKAGFEALFAGGCVRDMLLSTRSADYDVATSATPQQVRKLFKRVLLVGAQFGVAMVIVRRRRVEVATFRSENGYSDGRRPDHVTFTDARQDALRRDFTINGMFYDPISREVIDYVGGREDIRRGVVRTIGDPDARFGEDYLRMIRAVRFSVRLGFEIAPETAAAVRRHAGKIVGISGERILDELTKMLAKPSAATALERLAELELAAFILPEMFLAQAGSDLSFWGASVERVRRVAAKKDFTLSLGALLCELSKPALIAVVRRWGGSNELRDDLVFLASHAKDYLRGREMSLADLKRRMANRNFRRLVALWRAGEILQTGKAAWTLAAARRVANVDPLAVTPAPLLTGEDLKSLGLREGPELGKALRSLYDAQLNEQIRTRDEALEMLHEIIHTTAHSDS